MSFWADVKSKLFNLALTVFLGLVVLAVYFFFFDDSSKHSNANHPDSFNPVRAGGNIRRAFRK